MSRNHNQEHKDNKERKYSYYFDDLMKQYMLTTFEKFGVSGKLLELGCFEGAFTELLVDKYSDVTIIEASEELCSVVRNKFHDKVKVINSTFETAEIAEKYDTIFLLHTLEHLDNPVETLKKIKSWLSEDGKLYVACPNANAPSRQIAVKMGLISHSAIIG